MKVIFLCKKMCELREQEYDYFDTIMNKSLVGMAKIHNSLIALEECNAILRKDYANMIGKVHNLSWLNKNFNYDIIWYYNNRLN